MNKHHSHTQLFTVRLWQEGSKDDLRMKVQHVLSGETKYFSDTVKMMDYMLLKFQELEKEGHVES